MAIISISGRIGSGKDTVGKIIQILTGSPQLNTQGVMSFLKGEYNNPTFKIKKFADALKDMICLITGCTREQLEDQAFKNIELDEEWWYYKDIVDNCIYNYSTNREKETSSYFELIKPTYRLLLQQLGTECGRDIIHPNLWVNALFSKYSHKHCDWVITDMRFPNEMKAVKDRDGLTIRVNNPFIRFSDGSYRAKSKMMGDFDNEHPSETALDSAEFDEVINNNGTIPELIEQVKEILIRRNII